MSCWLTRLDFPASSCLSSLQALILLRNRGQLKPETVLPLFFGLFRCQDKQLRQMLFRHIVSGMLCGAVKCTQIGHGGKVCC